MAGTFSNSNNLQLDAKQTQQQHLTMKQRQALEVLFLSRQELETKLNEMLLTNPLIEVEEVPEDALSLSDSTERDVQEGTEDESLYEAEIYENSDSWNEELPLPPEQTIDRIIQERTCSIHRLRSVRCVKHSSQS